MKKCEGVPIQLNPIALRKAKIVYNFGLSGCNRVKQNIVGCHNDPNFCIMSDYNDEGAGSINQLVVM